MIAGSTISLHPLEIRHRDLTLAWMNEPQLMRLLDRSQPISDVEHQRWFTSLPQRQDTLDFAIENNAKRQHVGNVWLANIDRRHRKAELRIVIGSANHVGKGIGTEAISLLSTYAFQCLDLHKIYAYILSINPRARCAFEKAGFQLEGVLQADRWLEGSYTDVYFLGFVKPKSPVGSTAVLNRTVTAEKNAG